MRLSQDIPDQDQKKKFRQKYNQRRFRMASDFDPNAVKFTIKSTLEAADRRGTMIVRRDGREYNSGMELQPSSMILVALMPKARDMEIARLFGWYRIPMKSAPKILRVDYIAFYQTADFGADRAGRIERYAPVNGVELTTRSELFRDERDHPRANEYYYKIQLGALRTLPTPILAGRWRRFLFIYTNGRQFLSAKTIQDLAVTGAEHKVFWQSLRERGLSGPGTEFPFSTEDTGDALTASGELMYLLGNLAISNINFSINDMEKKP